MTRHTSAAKEFAAIMADASPDVRAANAHVAEMLGYSAATMAMPAPAPATPRAGSFTAPTEHEEQCALFAWAALHEEETPALRNLVAFPNGGYRPMATAAMLKAEGVKAGLLDMALFCKRGGFGALFIELKRSDRSNGCTLEQCEWIDRLRNYGYMAIVCFGAQEAIDAITAYLDQE